MAVEAKICGLTRASDAALAVRLGAAWLGVVFAEGRRQVTAAGAREVVAAAEGRPVLGVFVDQSVDAILRLRDRARLAGAQLHGAFGAHVRERLRAEDLVVWSVVRLAGEAEVGQVPEAASAADAVLVEPFVAAARGGTGTALPLELAAQARAAVPGTRFVLAGGLGPATVAAAIALVRPDVVDVSSGVEAAPGIKDAERMARFLEVVRDAGARA